MTPEELKENHRQVYDKMQRDIVLYGCAAMLKNDDGTYTHIPANKLRFHQSTQFNRIETLPFERP